MKKTSIILLFFVFTIATYSQTQLELNSMYGGEYSDADDELNRIYNQILKDYENDTTFINKLKASQRIWINFRDAELEMKFPKPEKRASYGSMYPMCAAGYLKGLTIDRIETLKQWLKPALEGDGCNGSVKYREIKYDDFFIDEVYNRELITLLNDYEILDKFENDKLSLKFFKTDNLQSKNDIPYFDNTNDIYIAIKEKNEIPSQNLFKISVLYKPNLIEIKSKNEDTIDLTIEHGTKKNLIRSKFEISIDKIKIVE